MRGSRLSSPLSSVRNQLRAGCRWADFQIRALLTRLGSLKGIPLAFAATAKYGFLSCNELEPAPASVGVFYQNPLNISREYTYNISSEREFSALMIYEE